jgi:cytochrome c-type biogenesis protein CcmH
LRRSGDQIARTDYDLEIYRDQLREIERDVERGLIDPSQATAARTEVERRMLAAAPAENGAPAGVTRPGPAISVAFVLLVALPLGAGSLYLWLGSPGVEGQPFSARERPPHSADGGVAGMDLEAAAERLAERLKSEPDDLEGWIMLGRTYGVLKRFDEAVDVLRHAAEMSNDDPAVVSLLGEHQVLAAGGSVSPEAIENFHSAIDKDPSQPVARFYLGLAEAQAGDMRAALDSWVALAKDAPADAPWLPGLRESIRDIAGELGVDVAAILPDSQPAAILPDSQPAAPGPTREQVEAAGEMPAEDRNEMIRTMVARLASRLEAEPDDLDGWIRLGRAYNVLGEAEQARDALSRAAALAPGNAEVIENYATAIVDALPSDATLPQDAITAFRRLAELDADNQSALWYLGRASVENGDTTEARALWQRLLALLPPDSPDRARVSRAIDQL